MAPIPYHIARNISFVILFGISATIIAISYSILFRISSDLTEVVSDSAPRLDRIHYVHAQFNSVHIDFLNYIERDRSTPDSAFLSISSLETANINLVRELEYEDPSEQHHAFSQSIKELDGRLVEFANELESSDRPNDSELKQLHNQAQNSLDTVLSSHINLQQHVEIRDLSAAQKALMASLSLAVIDATTETEQYLLSHNMQYGDVSSALNILIKEVRKLDTPTTKMLSDELISILKKYRTGIAFYIEEEKQHITSDTLYTLILAIKNSWSNAQIKFTDIAELLRRSIIQTQNRLSSMSQRTMAQFIWISLFAFFIMVLVAYWLQRILNLRMNRLLEGLKQVSYSKFEHRIDLPTQDRFEDIATGFNKMAGDLQMKERLIAHQLVGLRTAHDEVDRANPSLEERALERTQELERSKKIAEEANLSKSLFLANMSHELRTPMHSILSFSRIGIKKVHTATPEKLERYLENIENSGERLLRLLNDLLDLSKLEAGKMVYSFSKNNIVDVINQCLVDIKPVIDKSEVNISINDNNRSTDAYFASITYCTGHY